MHRNFFNYCWEKIHEFVEGAVNLFIFLPYFFSVAKLITSLFAPWKNLVSHKATRGFSFRDAIERLSFDLISRGLGFVMRCCLLSFYCLMQALYVLLLPFVFLFFCLLLPFAYVVYACRMTEDEKKSRMKRAFISQHLLDAQNQVMVEKWFELYYSHYLHKQAWWKISNLFSTPPLARDWSSGYTPILDDFCQDMTLAAYYKSGNRFIVGRKKELQLIEEMLLKQNGNNVILVGDEGVGKHTVIDALAQKIFEGKISNLLAYKRILKLNLEKILTVHKDQKERENFMEELFEEAACAKNIIIMIDSIDRYVSSGTNRVDLTTSIEKYAKDPRLQFIATSAPFLYQKYFYTNDKLNRLFEKIDISEITPVEAENILLEEVPVFEQRYNLFIPYESVSALINKSEYYITNIPFPEKALELLDSCCSYLVMKNKNNNNKLLAQITPQIINEVLSQKNHVPTELTDALRNKLLTIEQALNRQVLHQETAVNELAASLRRSFIMLGKRKKPLASFLFLGPTGVGKTETAKALSTFLFGSDKNLIRFDMSLYQTKDSIPSLIGSMDTGNPGLLTNAVRTKPFGVLLLDEIEKADKNLINIFLTLTDEGYITDGFGRKIDCKNLVVIATSNAGSQLYSAANGGAISSGQIIDYVIKNGIFAPEFLNRFDGVIAFNPINDDTARDLARKMMSDLVTGFEKQYNIKIIVSDETVTQAIEKGFNPQYGVRDLQHVLTREIEDKIAKIILEKKATAGATISL